MVTNRFAIHFPGDPGRLLDDHAFVDAGAFVSRQWQGLKPCTCLCVVCFSKYYCHTLQSQLFEINTTLVFGT